MELATTSSQTPAWLLPGMAGLFVAIGIGLLVAAARLRRKHKESISWPTVVGKIMASSVERHQDDQNRVWYRCHLRYGFVVDGSNYEGRTLAIGGGARSEKGAREEHERYPTGSAVTVYYNPAKPKDAILEHHPEAKPHLVLLIIGCAFLSSSVGILVVSRILETVK